VIVIILYILRLILLLIHLLTVFLFICECVFGGHQLPPTKDALQKRIPRPNFQEHLQPYVHDKPCDIQEQRFVVQFVLHPQLMSSINASYAGC
jgi:hypothetical protein